MSNAEQQALVNKMKPASRSAAPNSPNGVKTGKTFPNDR